MHGLKRTEKMSTVTFEHDTTIVGSVSRMISEIAGDTAAFFTNYIARSRAEAQLAALDDRLLQDIGLERADIRGKVWGSNAR
jgi:uncharacterized protein YjiS (DUF1127 family)